MAPIVLINGPSSSGKSHLITALQQAFPLSVAFSIDLFLGALSSQMMPRSPQFTDAFFFEFCEAIDGFVVRSGPLGESLVDAMYAAAEEVSRQGYPVFMEHLLLKEDWYHRFKQKFSRADVVEVEVNYQLDELLERERRRGDRLLGLACGTAFQIFHLPKPTWRITSDESAWLINQLRLRFPIATVASDDITVQRVCNSPA